MREKFNYVEEIEREANRNANTFSTVGSPDIYLLLLLALPGRIHFFVSSVNSVSDPPFR